MSIIRGWKAYYVFIDYEFLNNEIQVHGVGMSHHNVKHMIGNKAVLGAVMAEGPVEIN
jgi:hypothetical protein